MKSSVFDLFRAGLVIGEKRVRNDWMSPLYQDMKELLSERKKTRERVEMRTVLNTKIASKAVGAWAKRRMRPN